MPARGARSSRVVLDERRLWENQHQNYRQRIQGIYLLSNDRGNPFTEYNRTRSVVQRLVRGAQRKQDRLRALGSGWSFSKVSVTNGFLLNTKQLNIFFPYRRNLLDPAYPGDADKLFCFQCGTTVKAINRRLAERQLSLKTSGASNGQTIAGAVSTGTHGAAIDVGAMPDSVVAMHLLTGPSSHVWLERASYPVVKPRFPELLGARLVRDDELFNAALVSLGSFGVILSLTIETEDQYLLEAHTKRMPLSRKLRAAMNTLDFRGLRLPRPNERPYHFDVVINPHDPGGKVLVTTMYKQEYRDYEPPVFDDDEFTLGDDALAFLSRVIDTLPEVVTAAAVPGLITRVLNDRYPEFSKQYGTLGEVFSATTIRGKIASTAIGVPAARASDALNLVLDLNRGEGPFPGALGMRFVKGTQATLGFTRFPKTCVLEIDGIDGETARAFYQKLWRALDESDIEYTLHWGKMHDLTRTRVRRMYGNERVDAWIRARERLLRPATREVFSSPFLRRAGLAG